MTFALVRDSQVVARSNANGIATDPNSGVKVTRETPVGGDGWPVGLSRYDVVDVPVVAPSSDQVSDGYSEDFRTWTAGNNRVERVERWRERAVNDAREACELRRSYRAMAVHSSPVEIALAGVAAPSGVEVDTYPDGSIGDFHAPEDSAVVLMSAMTEKARGVVDDDLVAYGVPYWQGIQAYRTELSDIDMRGFNVFRLVGSELVKTRIKVRNIEVESKLLDPYRETMPDRQTDYEDDIRAFEKASTIAEYDALFL